MRSSDHTTSRHYSLIWRGIFVLLSLQRCQRSLSIYVVSIVADKDIITIDSLSKLIVVGHLIKLFLLGLVYVRRCLAIVWPFGHTFIIYFSRITEILAAAIFWTRVLLISLNIIVYWWIIWEEL